MKKIFIALSIFLSITYLSEAKRIFRAKIKRDAGFEVTLSLFKADVGSIGGHTRPAGQIIELLRSELYYAVQNNTLIDGFVFHIGDDICLVLAHDKGPDSDSIHELAGNCFSQIHEQAKKLGCCGQKSQPVAPRVIELSFQHLLDDARPVESFMIISTHKNETQNGFWANIFGSDDDSIALVRTQRPFDSPEELLVAFTTAELLPVPINTAATGPLGMGLVCCVGFSMNKSGQFAHDYVDFFNNPAWDYIRLRAAEKAIAA